MLPVIITALFQAANDKFDEEVLGDSLPVCTKTEIRVSVSGLLRYLYTITSLMRNIIICVMLLLKFSKLRVMALDY